MATCYYCGDEIEFRFIDGRPTPIHINGGSCFGGASSTRAPATTRTYTTIEAYTNPNANCPVCGASVFFVQTSNGGRVFFDALGWPWPKHHCTDNGRGEGGGRRLTGRLLTNFRDASGEIVDIYVITHVSEENDLIFVHTKFAKKTYYFGVHTRDPDNVNITLPDIASAPAFIIPRKRASDDTISATFLNRNSGSICSVLLLRG